MTSIIDKIRKLFAHAESAAAIGNQAEAEAFAAKAAAMLASHKIDAATVRLDITDEPEELINREDVPNADFFGGKTSVGWKGVLAQGLSAAYFVHIVKLGHSVAIVGKPSDRAVFLYTYQQLVQAAMTLGARQPGGRRETNAWRLGFAVGVAAKLRTERMEQERASNPHALVLVNARAAVAKCFGDLFPNARKGSSVRTTGSSDAYERGRSAGQAHHTQRGVYGGRGSNLQLGSGK